MQKYKVVELFTSIEGEGKRAGQPVHFLRLEGCNLRCLYCDTAYSYDDAEFEEWDLEYLLAKIRGMVFESRIQAITITGGEPLLHDGIEELLQALLNEGYDINVETNGTLPRPTLNEYPGTIFYTYDYKTFSSGMNTNMVPATFSTMRKGDVIKCVVGSIDDMDDAVNLITAQHFVERKIKIYFSPIFGSIKPKEIVEYILDKGLSFINVQVQLHKVIWDPNQKGV